MVNMFINTQVANQRSRPLITITQYPYDASAPVVGSPVGQDEPPSYIEATTPGLYTGATFDGEGARLLASDGYAGNGESGGEKWYQRRVVKGVHWSKKGWFKRTATVLAVGLLAIMLVVTLAAVTPSSDRQVCRLIFFPDVLMMMMKRMMADGNRCL